MTFNDKHWIEFKEYMIASSDLLDLSLKIILLPIFLIVVVAAYMSCWEFERK